MATFLLEIRTEEIPANALPGARQQLRQGFDRQLTAAGFSGFVTRALSTSRRLVTIVENLPVRQPDRQEEVTGPPCKVAFAADGTPTRAAEGFARKVGVPVDQLAVVTTAKGEYLGASVVHEGQATTDILAAAVPKVVTTLRFPKMMRWGLGQHLFVRPVHSVVALLDEQIVPLTLFDVASGRETVGHRVHSPAPLAIAQAETYLAELEARSVLVDHMVRSQKLSEQAASLAAEKGCRVHPDPTLAAEHVELVEFPGLVRGEINRHFLELPREVVITTLRHHQKCLILEKNATDQAEQAELTPFFLAVIDRGDDPEGLICQGNQWVIRARLADAGFFFAEDSKTNLDQLVPGLARLDFHRRLGSLAAKTDRIGELAAFLATAAGVTIDPAQIRQTAPLVKADLLTNMVGEFPELQGVMGGHYLRLEGAEEAVWTAVRDHYRPVGFEGEIPASPLGCLLGAADRLDTLAGLFLAGEIPSGSRDPFGLRRAAQGLVRIIAEAGWDLDLAAATRRAVELLAPTLEGDPEKAIVALDGFIADRVRRYLSDLIAVAGDTAEAVMAADRNHLPELIERARALDKVRSRSEFRALALAFKRVRNITDGLPDAGVAEHLLAEPEELELHRAAQVFHDELTRLLPARRLSDAFVAMGQLAEVLDLFFVKVLVMADDEQIRNNRIALLKFLGRDFLKLADLSRLQVEGGDQQ